MCMHVTAGTLLVVMLSEGIGGELLFNFLCISLFSTCCELGTRHLYKQGLFLSLSHLVLGLPEYLVFPPESRPSG